jgi:transmembrane sensor
MNDYNRLIENPLFFKWIFYSSPEIDAYWNHYLENNVASRKQITELKSQIELHLKYDDKKLSDQEKKALASRIARKLDQTDEKRIRGRIIRSLCGMLP